MNARMTFKPRSSTGWIWVGAIGAVAAAAGVAMAGSLGFTGPFLTITLIIMAIGVGFLLLAAFFPTMRYELEDSRLLMSYGPFLHYTVNLAEIKNIRSCNLSIGMVSSFRFPGLALFSVPYPEAGMVNMCATASSNRILLIETSTKKYGITPADEAAFVTELHKRMGH